MWDDVVIGKGDKGCSAMKVWKCPELLRDMSIAENPKSYWISRAWYEGGMTVFKDTPEGQKITKAIESGNASKITNLIELIFLKKAKPEVINRLVKDATNTAYQRGYEDRALLIREALGI